MNIKERAINTAVNNLQGKFEKLTGVVTAEQAQYVRDMTTELKNANMSQFAEIIAKYNVAVK